MPIHTGHGWCWARGYKDDFVLKEHRASQQTPDMKINIPINATGHLTKVCIGEGEGQTGGCPWNWGQERERSGGDNVKIS